MSSESFTSDKDQRTWGMLCHLTQLSTFLGVPGFIGPLVIWLLKKDEMPFVDDQGKEALNFQITVFLMALVSGALICVAVGIGLLIALGIWAVIMPIVGAVKANDGVGYRYPLTLRLIK